MITGDKRQEVNMNLPPQTIASALAWRRKNLQMTRYDLSRAVRSLISASSRNPGLVMDKYNADIERFKAAIVTTKAVIADLECQLVAEGNNAANRDGDFK